MQSLCPELVKSMNQPTSKVIAGNKSLFHWFFSRFAGGAQWLATVLGRHYLFPVPLGIYLICLHSLKSFVEFEFCAKKAISGSYGLENSQIFLKKVKNF